MIGAAHEAAGILTVGFNRRCAPLLIDAKKALEPRGGPLVMLYRINAGAIPGDSWIQRDEGGGRIVARTGQKEFERFVQAVRKAKPYFDAGWAALLEQIPAAHQAIIADRIQSYRNSILLQNIAGKVPLKELFVELENYAGSEIDAEYP